MLPCHKEKCRGGGACTVHFVQNCIIHDLQFSLQKSLLMPSGHVTVALQIRKVLFEILL